MTSPDQDLADERMEVWLSRLLQIGVALAAAVIAIGGIVYLVRRGSELPAFRHFGGEPEDLRSVGRVLYAAAALSGRAVIQLGLLLLIATPVSRVAFSLVAFARNSDWVYVAISSAVLALVLLGLLGVV